MSGMWLDCGKERESCSDSGFEDGPSSPTKVNLDKASPPTKITVSKERRERRMQERRNIGVTSKNDLADLRREQREGEDLYRAPETKPVKKCGKDCTECNVQAYATSPKGLIYEQAYIPVYPEIVKREKSDKQDDTHYRAEDERDHRGHKYSIIPPPPLMSLRPTAFTWLPPPFPSPLSLIRRQSVITSACCPQQYAGTENISICPCANPKCNIQAISFGSHVGGHSAVKREVFSTVPPGFELPTVEEHFRKSLGSDYEEVTPGEPLNSVDEHFAKALGNTWYSLKYKKAIESQFRTRERVLTSCNL
ncbi:uncharacterized protein LOC135686565 isoform X2 [Rhopilema esculentum]|uniref:uncharacterized protein LOC135686565 isoform X2 n=1 Tax=Rhopilema esculentum TaxID=499914 RepID=UPI0031D1E06B